MRTKIIDLGLIEYKDAWDLQEKKLNFLAENRENNKSLDKEQAYLLFCEHPHVYTLGKSGQQNNLLINDEFLSKINASYYRTNRGGDITYHGPGQIVVYPIFDLNIMKIGVKEYVYRIEEVVIKTLMQYNINAERLDGATGVWIDTKIEGKARKICAIGIKITKFISMHGLAFNINTDLSYFNHINPCGFVDKSVTSLKNEKNRSIDFEEAKKRVRDNFISIFNLNIIK